MIFILYQKIRTLPKNSYFTENFVLYQTIRTPDCYGLAIYIYHYTSLYTSARWYHREKYIIGLLASIGKLAVVVMGGSRGLLGLKI